jgi:LuxR family maltose regulon positive regulatory protein
VTRRLPVGTKCSAPRLPDAFVHRPRLDRLFAEEQRRPVTLVSAGPGAGKTTLLASWFTAAPDGRVAWLSLDHRDDDARRLAGLVVAALERAGALPDFAAPAASGDLLLDAAFEHLMGLGEPCVLMIDDLQEVSSARALRSLAHLVERAPTVLDLVLASRADPPIGWGRLILDGRLRQIRIAELSFRPGEAAELLAAHGVHLGAGHTRLLCERTEGWAAGLRLAACALQSEDEPQRFVLSTSATQVAVSDYLLKEVLVRQDRDAQLFLLRTSVTDRLTPDLAAALTGDGRAGERLAALERRGVFLVELDEHGSYRYHALFGALLRARLRLEDPDLFIELHHRAAQWHLDNGLQLEAEEHARAAGDWDLVGRLVLARWLDAALDGERLSPGALVGLPPAVTLRTPELALVLAAEACSRCNREEADVHRGVLDRAVAAGHAGPSDPAGAAAWQVARPLLDVAYGRAFGDDPRARAGVEALLFPAAADIWTSRVRRLALLRSAELDLDAGQLARARGPLHDLASDREDGWIAAEAVALLAVLDAADGEVVRAEERAAAALVPVEDETRPSTAQAAHLALALCKAQRGEERGALGALGAAAVDPASLSRALRPVLRTLSAATMGRAGVLPRVDRPPADEPLTDRALVALGVVEVADADGRVVRVGGDGERAVGAARRWLAGDAPGPAPGAVEAWLDGTRSGSPAATRPGAHPRTLIEAGVLAALLASARGEPDVVARRLEPALDRAAASGIRTPFDAHAERLRPLIEAHLGALGESSGLAVDLLDRLARPEARVLVEPLTDREREVLHHLPTLMSNVEIAEGMHLSVNTVKTHLKAVYRKLGVEGRRQAVLRGRELELI